MKATLLALGLLAAAPALAQKKATATAPVAAIRYELRGVITYLFNSNFGNRPDAGAKAFIIKRSLLKVDDSQLEALTTYLENHDYVEHTGPSSNTSTRPKMLKMPDEMTPAEKIEALQDDALAVKQQILDNPDTLENTADGAGVFTKKLAPGDYIVLMRSAHRNRINPLETQGQLAVRRVTIIADDKEVSANFNP